MRHNSYTYKQINIPDGETSPHDRRAWFLKPSVYWLLPVLILFNISMGALAMPRINLIISLTCRNVLSEMIISVPLLGDIQTKKVARDMSAGNLAGALLGDSLPNNTSIADIVIGEHNEQCSVKEIESATALLLLWGNLIAGILGAIMTPVWGRLSDRYGRVKPLATATAIMVLSGLIEGLMAVLPDVFSLKWIYLSFILEGLSGTFILIMALGSAYAADCTPPNQRSITMGLLHGSMYFGMALGPVLGGFVGMSGGESRPLVILYTTIGFNAFGVIYILFLIPESLPLKDVKALSDLSQKYGYDDLNSGNILEVTQRLNPLRILRGIIPAEASSNPPLRRNLITFAALNTLVFTSLMAGMNVIMLYSEHTFKWDNQASGIFLSSVNIARAAALVLLLPLAAKLFNNYMPLAICRDSLDLVIIRISIISGIIGYVGYALAPTGALFTLAGIIASLDSIALAISEATVSRLAGRARMGEVLGALGFLQASGRILGPTFANMIYSQIVGVRPNLVFFGFGSIFMVAGIITFAAKPGQGGTISNDEIVEEEGIPLEGASYSH